MQWIMTVFDAVAAHWPKPAKLTQTQKSRMSIKLSSQNEPSSSPQPSSPPPIDSGEEEPNPFELAVTQASQHERVEAEVNVEAVQSSAVEDDEEDMELRQHEEAAKFHAKEGERFRATQQVKAEEFDENDLDQLFRETVKGDETPQRSRLATPTSRGSTEVGTASTGTRREKRYRRLAEQAGFGDLR